jgi:predicted DNA-binding protein YlxM (UPF0122 family)
MQKPNIGKKWSLKEDELLLSLLEDHSIDEIAHIQKRTVNSINFRIRKIAYNMFLDNIELKCILEKTKLTEKQLFDTINYKLKTNFENTYHIFEKIENIEINDKIQEEIDTINDSIRRLNKLLNNIEKNKI